MSVTILGPIEPSGVPLILYSFRVPAGFPSPAQDHIEQEISLDELLDIRAPHVYLIRFSARSLEGIGIFDGDYGVVDRSIKALSGHVVIAVLNGESVAKIFSKVDDQIMLLSANPDYASRYILEGDELMIWGVIKHSVRCHALYA